MKVALCLYVVPISCRVYRCLLGGCETYVGIDCGCEVAMAETDVITTCMQLSIGVAQMMPEMMDESVHLSGICICAFVWYFGTCSNTRTGMRTRMRTATRRPHARGHPTGVQQRRSHQSVGIISSWGPWPYTHSGRFNPVGPLRPLRYQF
jgi:hypothetical protein